MNDCFDQLAKGLAQSLAWRGALKRLGVGLAGIALTSLFAGQMDAFDLYVDGNANANGDGTAAQPYWRITDAVARARSDRQNAAIPASETIVIHVAPGAYIGSYGNPGSNKKMELLPIVLNMPNVVLSGATVLALDGRSLPTGIVPGTPETILASIDPLDSDRQSLIAIVRTTDGGAGDNVTVTGFTLDQPFVLERFGNFVFAHHVSGFAIRENRMRHAGIGVDIVSSSGTLEGNLITDSPSGPGTVVAGGSVDYPAQVTVRSNRMVNNGEHGMMAMPQVPHNPPDLGQNKFTVLQGKLHGSNADAHRLDLTIIGNDFSQNFNLGLRLLMICPDFVFEPADIAVTPVLAATVTGNTMIGNGNYGLDVEGGDTYPEGGKTFSGEFVGTFWGNQFLGNGRNGAIFTYTFGNRPPSDSSIYVRDSVYQVLDLDGELAGFDYANPLNDPIDGTALNNQLIVNGAVIASGIKISSLNP